MEMSNEVKIIGMLGDINNKITDMNMNIKDIKETMNRNFTALADNQVNVFDKLNKISEDIRTINFRLDVAEAGVGLNANKIREINNIG